MKIVIASLILMVTSAYAVGAEEMGDLGAIVVQASRSQDTALNMNKDVTIITAADIAQAPGKTLPDFLTTLPGLYVANNGSIHDVRIDMGGFGVTGVSNVLVLVDGRRLNEPDLTGADLSLIDVNTVDHIEIIQGSGTVLYGDNASGGVINIVTKKGQENHKPSVSLSSAVGSDKMNTQGLGVSGGFTRLSYQFNYDRQETNNYRTNDNYWANDYDTHLEYKPTDIFGIDFSQGYHLDRYRLPGGLSVSDIMTNGRTSADVNNLSVTTVSDRHFDLTPHLKFEAGDSHGDLTLFTSARKRDYNDVYPNGLYAGSTQYQTESYAYQPKLTLETPLSVRLDNKLTTGYDYAYNKEGRNIYSVGNSEDIFYATESTHSAYALDELTWDRKWLLNLGARAAWADYIFNQTQQAVVKLNRGATTEGYEGGLGYLYNPDSKIFVNYNRVYRLPVIDEFLQSPYESAGQEYPAALSPNLKYQIGHQYQLGVRDQSFKGVHLGATATACQYKDEIYFDPNTYLNQNYNGRTRHYSQEVDLAVDMFHNKLQPFVNITFQQSLFVKGIYSGRQMPFVPDHLANAGIVFKPWNRWSTSLVTHFVGKEFLDADYANAAAQLKRHDTLDWHLEYGFKNVDVWVAVQNILNTMYYAYGINSGPSSNSYYPAAGRNIQAGMKIRF